MGRRHHFLIILSTYEKYIMTPYQPSLINCKPGCSSRAWKTIKLMKAQILLNKKEVIHENKTFAVFCVPASVT